MSAWRYSIALLATLAGTFAGGCEDPDSDMGQQPKYVTYEPSDFFFNDTSARPLVPGVVPRDADATGAAAINDVAPAGMSIPLAIDAGVIRRGADEYNTFCAVCHGRLGNGDGIIVQRGFARPPSFHIARLREAPDSHIYNVITQGYGAMFSYNDRVPPLRRWEIVAYIRALQAAVESAGTNLSPEDRQSLTAAGAGEDRPPPPKGGDDER